ncbi:MAG: hypothetical protein HC789_22030 [Microcoleus sp. CSU_2_2]|nr:hypothetical protein [Microcoleus sp. SU_5_3]NJS12858.1 hypothetical protein [Microcoleus sp. CSU_2_2]
MCHSQALRNIIQNTKILKYLPYIAACLRIVEDKKYDRPFTVPAIEVYG